MSLHPVIRQVVDSLPEPDGQPIDPAAARAAEAQRVPPPEERIPVDEVRDEVAQTQVGPVPVRIYQHGASPDGGRAVLVYLHGGAFYSGSLDTHDHVAREIAIASHATVVSVGYRLAPEHPYPAGLDDSLGVVRWVAANGAALGWDGRRLAVAGDSSGATFAAGVAGDLRDAGEDLLTHMVLLYPSVDLDFDEDRWPSMRENATGYGLETAMLKPANAFYLETADPDDPRAAPIKRTDLSGFPATLILTAQYDPLRDEGEAYAEKLRGAGVPVTARRVAGANHGFVQNFGALPEFHGVFTEIAEFLDS